MNPKVGDRVRLVHTNGDEATVTVVSVIEVSGVDAGIETETHHFWLDDGWTVAEIVTPPEGTLVEGVDFSGDTFRGVVLRNGVVGAYETESGTWILASYNWGDIKSWSIVNKADTK